MGRLISARTLIVLIVGTGLATAASADTITVCWDGSGDYLIIQEGIDAASDGDEVVVCDGTYTGPGNKNLDFAGKLITVRSENGPDSCTIDCEGAGRGFYFHSGETAASVVDGFTITNGNADVGGAIYWTSGDEWYETSPTITNCWILGNTALNGGGLSGFKCLDYKATIANCLVAGNSATGTDIWSGGGGIHHSWCDLEIRNCIIANNWAAGSGGGINSVVAGLIIRNCTIAGNQADGEWGGGGVYVNAFTWLVMANCTVTRNEAVCGGGVSFEWGDDSDVISDSVLWANTWEQIFGGEPSVRYCDVQGGWPGEGNIDTDPLFASGPLGDYYLSQMAAGQDVDSPCVNAGSDTAENLGLDTRTTRTDQVPDSGIVDMGYHYPIVCLGDLDGDGDIDLSDLAQLLSNYGTTSGACYADGDLDGDGDVDLDDLAALLAVYGTECTMAGDNCDNPLRITLSSQDLPYAEVNTTCGRGNDYEGTCLSDFDTGEDLIYELTILETMEVDIVVNPHDAYWTAVAVSDTCPPGATCLAYTCGYSDVRIIPSLVLDPGVYYVMVDSQAPDCIDELTLIIRDALPCDIDCPPGADLETEACGEDLNGGCGAMPPAFEPITCGETVCGTVWAEDYMRDTDWYEVTVTEATRFTWHIVSEFPAVIGLVETDPPGSGNCNDMTGYLNPWDIDSACANATITTDLLPPGTYWFHVSHNEFYCDPCGQKNDYVATLTCETLSGPGDDCNDPVVVTLSNDSLPRAVLGTTCGRGNDYEDTCLEQWDGGEDFICEVHVTEEMVITIVLGTFDTDWTGVAIDDTCPPGNSCLAYSTAGDNEYWQHTEMVHLVPGTYYVIVDTWPSPNCIPVFELIFDYPPP